LSHPKTVHPTANPSTFIGNSENPPESHGGETCGLTLIEREPIRGSWPRNFNVDPTGKWLLAAGRDSNTIAVFGINAETGELTYTRTMVMVPTPICVLFGSRAS